jgi:hypothetical protein
MRGEIGRGRSSRVQRVDKLIVFNKKICAYNFLFLSHIKGLSVGGHMLTHPRCYEHPAVPLNTTYIHMSV